MNTYRRGKFRQGLDFSPGIIGDTNIFGGATNAEIQTWMRTHPRMANNGALQNVAMGALTTVLPIASAAAIRYVLKKMKSGRQPTKQDRELVNQILDDNNAFGDKSIDTMNKRPPMNNESRAMLRNMLGL